MAVIVNINGRLGKDAEVINSSKGQFVSFSVATDEFKNGKRDTTWLRVAYNGDKALHMAQYYKKGTAVCVTGAETVSTWVDRNGNVQISRDVNAFNVDFLPNNSSATTENAVSTNEKSNEAKQPQEFTTGSLTPPNVNVAEEVEDELPF